MVKALVGSCLLGVALWLGGCSDSAEREARREVLLEAALNDEQARQGAAFLERNRTQSGVTETASGLQYRIVRAGTGDRPDLQDRVRVHYRGELLDGSVFDSSYSRGRPAEFPVGAVIAGWQEALQLMPAGSHWRLFIPASLAYGARSPSAKIPPNATLIFDVELIDIVNR